MSYYYFLKNRYVNKIPTIKFITTNITEDGKYQEIKSRYVYAGIPNELNKHEFNRLIKNTSIAIMQKPSFHHVKKLLQTARLQHLWYFL